MVKSEINSDFINAFAYAKINLHLEILGNRNDGYHELAMIMQSIDLYDQLKMTKLDNNNITLKSNNLELSIGDDNLIIKAAKLLRIKSGIHNLGVNIELIKDIPIGAGLAGGSTDAAATLVGLNKLWDLNFSSEELENIAQEIGSDIPFCVSGGRQFCFGRGEVLEKIQNSNSNIGVILVKDPSIQISTPLAYKNYKKQYGSNYLSNEIDFEKKRNEIRLLDWINDEFIETHTKITNDLQKSVYAMSTHVQKSLEVLRDLQGSRLVAMSGSGPSCFALFSTYDEANNIYKLNSEKFKRAGLSAWACSMKSFGVEIKDEFI